MFHSFTDNLVFCGIYSLSCIVNLNTFCQNWLLLVSPLLQSTGEVTELHAILSSLSWSFSSTLKAENGFTLPNNTGDLDRKNKMGW